MTSEDAHNLVMEHRFLPNDTAGENRSFLANLIERAKYGDADAFDGLMGLTQKRVARLCWRILGDEDDARDATQEVFIRVYKYLHRFEIKADFFGWLYRITINVCRDISRQRGTRRALFSTIESESEADYASDDDRRPDEVVLLDERRAMVKRAITLLPEKERIAFILREYEGLTTEEVSRVMKSRPGTVRVQISAARGKIKKYCERLIAARK